MVWMSHCNQRSSSASSVPHILLMFLFFILTVNGISHRTFFISFFFHPTPVPFSLWVALQGEGVPLSLPLSSIFYFFWALQGNENTTLDAEAHLSISLSLSLYLYYLNWLSYRTGHYLTNSILFGWHSTGPLFPSCVHLLSRNEWARDKD